MTAKRHLAFVSPRFLFPADSGGKIRTTQILRGLRGGAFEISLLMPITPAEQSTYKDAIEEVCDEHIGWPAKERGRFAEGLRKIAMFPGRRPISVASDFDPDGAEAVLSILGRNPDAIVFDFPHSAVLAPDRFDVASIVFTHNIEAEIFKRHVAVAKSPLARAVWRDQYRKMERYERSALHGFDMTIAVSERDRRFFEKEWGIKQCREIPTGVDTEFFEFRLPKSGKQVVFCGSMDWMANIDGIEFFHDSVWPLIRAKEPAARMKVVGRAPPESLVKRILAVSSDWEFTGFVDDIREHAAGAAAFVIPLRVGGGTRIKAFEAMAMGSPVVSTSIGVEGLPVEDGVHCLLADDKQEMADLILELLGDTDRRQEIARTAREFVESNFGFRKAADAFERICLEAIENSQSVS